jgi:hypothetical protein
MALFRETSLCALRLYRPYRVAFPRCPRANIHRHTNVARVKDIRTKTGNSASNVSQSTSNRKKFRTTTFPTSLLTQIEAFGLAKPHTVSGKYGNKITINHKNKVLENFKKIDVDREKLEVR